MNHLYPLRFREILRNYEFGNRWIPAEFPKTGLPTDHRISETWEVVDRGNESSEILNGPWAGKTLRECIAHHGPALLGTEMIARFGTRFPLLIKFLDATFPLGEQVHPDDALTKKWGLDDHFGKTEAWYMLRTRNPATVRCGNIPGLTREQLLAELIAGRGRECMTEVPTKPGDCFLLYAGAMHYSAGGVLFYEVQQSSNVWVGLGPTHFGTTPEDRQRLGQRAVEAVHLEANPDYRPRPVALRVGANTRTFAAVCQHFALERLDLSEPHTIPMDGRKFRILTAIAGDVQITQGSAHETLTAGQTTLLPATAGDVRIEPNGPASLLLTYVPDLDRDIVAPLKGEGISADAIRKLGGQTDCNPL